MAASSVAFTVQDLGASVTISAVFAPFLAGIAAPLVTKVFGARAGWVLAIVPLAIFAHFLSYVGPLSQGEVWTTGVAWIPAYGVQLSFYLDGLSVLFALLISGIGALIVIYAGGYMKGHPNQGRFLAFILLFMGAMLGVVTANDFVSLFVFWELTSITSFLLIGFNHHAERSRRSAVQALVVTGAGGLALLAGLLVIRATTGATDLAGLFALKEAVKGSEAYAAIFVLICLAAFTKSAQFPFHFWLPNAMEAPTPVSAYLHSATMVKAGVYLLMRMHPALGETALWTTVLPLFGAATLLLGALLAVKQTDLKLMLAQTTVASLGLLVMLVGTSVKLALMGAVLYLFAHSLFKGALFMVAGTIDHEAGTRDVTKLGGLRRAMPITFGAALVAALSMAGLPPMVGFVAKEVLYEGTAFGLSFAPIALTAAAILGNALMFVIGFSVALKPFLGAPVDTPKPAHEGPPSLWLGPVLLGVVGLVSGLFVALVGAAILVPMAGALVGYPFEKSLYLIPKELKLPVFLSLGTYVLGFVLYRASGQLRTLMQAACRVISWGPDRGFDQFMRFLLTAAAAIAQRLQFGSLSGYLRVTFAIAAVAVTGPLLAFDELPAWPAWPQPTLYEFTIVLMTAIGIVAVVMAKTRLIGVISLGIQGTAVALLFLLFGAADLSFTQFMVETLSVVILALVLTQLNIMNRDRRPMHLVLPDALIALLLGIGLSLTLLGAISGPFNTTLSDFFATYSREIAHGRNIVNVIIVDFRAVDTLGEIAVVLATGLAILALIRVRRQVHHPRKDDSASDMAPERGRGTLASGQGASNASLAAANGELG